MVRVYIQADLYDRCSVRCLQAFHRGGPALEFLDPEVGHHRLGCDPVVGLLSVDCRRRARGPAGRTSPGRLTV